MKYVIDIDGTICTNTEGKYAEALPHRDRIEMINLLYDKGHRIVYFTARGMGTSGEDVSSANLMWYEFTKNQLRSWNAKFHDLIVGKPSADYYVDDRMIGISDFFQTIGGLKK